MGERPYSSPRESPERDTFGAFAQGMPMAGQNYSGFSLNKGACAVAFDGVVTFSVRKK